MTAKKKPPGIIMKYFPDCYSYEEGELNRILSAALQTKECQQVISKIKLESREITLSPNAPKERVEKVLGDMAIDCDNMEFRVESMLQ